MDNTYKVFTLSLARKLRDKGFRIVEVIPNKDKPWLNVYCFSNTEEFRQALQELQK